MVGWSTTSFCFPSLNAGKGVSQCFRALVFALICLGATVARAQQAANVVVAPGNAAVTGFSGTLPPVQIPPGSDPGEKTFIDLHGPSLRVVDLQHMGGPPAAQLVGAPKPFTFGAAQIGQVFGVTLDDNAQPNVYAAATSAYGLPIVVLGADGKLQHVKRGAANAAFMPGLWGPQGGPGSIWKIDGVTGKVALFANIAFEGRNNSGAALGALAFDPNSKSLFVSDRESGFIYRLALDGRILDHYDHGVAGRQAQGLPPVSWNSQQPIDIATPRFDSTDPSTWNYAAPERRIFGLAVFRQRLYYAVADGLQIWSVGLNADGAFGSDPMIELAVPPSSGPTEISTITFDEQGRMFLAERAAPTGDFDLEALAVPAIGRVLRYAQIGRTPDGHRIWQERRMTTPSAFRMIITMAMAVSRLATTMTTKARSSGRRAAVSCGRPARICAIPPMRHWQRGLASLALCLLQVCRATAHGASNARANLRSIAILSITLTRRRMTQRADIWAQSRSRGRAPCVRQFPHRRLRRARISGKGGGSLAEVHRPAHRRVGRLSRRHKRPGHRRAVARPIRCET